MICAAASFVTIALRSTCNSQPQDVRETGLNPQLPAQVPSLIPSMKIAKPVAWGHAKPTVPAGFSIMAVATDLKMPRQMMLLPNGDLLVAEGKGGLAPKLRPKDVIAAYIKGIGTTDVKGGDRITLLRDADGDRRPELRTVFIDKFDAPYRMALVGNELFVAEQGALQRFAYVPGATSITIPAWEVTKLPSRIYYHWTKSLAASADGLKLYVGIGSNSNVGRRGMEVEQDRAVVWEIDRQTGAHRAIATGIRNPTALAIEPTTKAL